MRRIPGITSLLSKIQGIFHSFFSNGCVSYTKHTEEIGGKQKLTKVSNKLIIIIITYMKKLHDSDWLRAVQLESNTSANYKSKLLNLIFSP